MFHKLSLKLAGFKSKMSFRAFTLVELIVVIIILVVLAVIAVMTVTSWISKGRDSRRKSDITSLNNGLNLYISEHSIFPDPDNYFLVKDNTGAIAWYQGEFGSGNKQFLQGLKKEPKDPTGGLYGYSITSDKKKFQLRAFLENGQQISVLGDSLYAASNRYNYLKGPYDGWLITHTGNYYALWRVPSLFGPLSGFVLSTGTLDVDQDGKSSDATFPVGQVLITDLYNGGDSNAVYNKLTQLTGYDGQPLDVPTAATIVKTAPGVEASLLSAQAPSGEGGALPESQVPPTIGDVPDQYLTLNAVMDVLSITGYVTLTNGDAITAFELSGTLPTGLTFNTTTGKLTGTPTVQTTVNVQVRAQDNDGWSARDTFIINIGVCGDNQVQDGEQCDFGAQNGQAGTPGEFCGNTNPNKCKVTGTAPNIPVCTFNKTAYGYCKFQ